MGKRKAKKNPPAWFGNKASEEDKFCFRKAVVDYIIQDCGDKNDRPKPSHQVYLDILPKLKVLLSKWKTVNADNFNPNKWEMHENYQTTVRNLLQSKKKLDAMVNEEVKNMAQSISDEEAEEEMIEDEQDHIIPQAGMIDNFKEQSYEKMTDAAPINAIQVDSILRKTGEKRPRSELLIAPGDISLKRQRIEDLECAHDELEEAHAIFIDKVRAYRTIKANIKFVNTPVYIKNIAI